MTDAELSELERLAKAATPGPWKRKNAHGILLKDEIHSENGALVAMALAKRHPLNGEQYVGYEQTESNAAYIAAVGPDVILGLISQLRACRELIEVLMKAGAMTESIAFTRSHFDRAAYAEVCRNIPELCQKVGLPRRGD